MPKPQLLVDPNSAHFSVSQENGETRISTTTTTPNAGPKKPEKDKKQSSWVLFGIIAFFVLIVGILTGFLIFEFTRKPKFLPHPTNAPTSTTQKLANVPTGFFPEFTQEAITNESSPQAKAWAWLQEHPDFVDMSNYRKRQLMALATLFYSTGGEVHWSSTNWLEASTHECAWDYSTCTWGGVYISIELTNLGLAGSIPPEMSFLTSLNELILWDNNKLKGTIPTQIGELTSLTHLALVNAGLNGWIPSELGKMSKLTYLGLQLNDLYGTIPAQFGQLRKLNWLSLWGNRLSGPLPNEFWGLRSLQHLSIYQNDFTGTLPTTLLSNMKALTSLGLYQNSFRGQLPTEFGSLVKLTWLSLSDNKFSGPVPTELGKLTKLTWLSLRDNRFSGTIPSELGSMAVLTTLYLSGNDMRGRVPDGICELSNLDFFLIDCSEITCTCSSICGCN